MFEKFGEMGSASEINILASNLLKEGDYESIKILAKENGLDPEDAEDFISGDLKYLCNDLTAALGKIDIEAKELKCKELMADWVEWIKLECAESTEEGFTFAKAVRSKGKTLAGALGEILKASWEIKCKIPDAIVKAAGISSARVEFGIPGTATTRKIIAKYYGGKI